MSLFSWKWWFSSDAGLLARIALGSLIFLALAGVDLLRHGRQATRWREYSFLLMAVALALLYGIINDQITVSISWEYFYYGKGLSEVLGHQLPPPAQALRWEAAKIGLQATWSAGLLIGVALLLANNPRATRRQLSCSGLMRGLGTVFACAVAGALLLGLAGGWGAFVPLSRDFAQMVQRQEFRPYRFMAVYGVHLGGYVGGLLGTAVAVRDILRRRRA